MKTLAQLIIATLSVLAPSVSVAAATATLCEAAEQDIAPCLAYLTNNSPICPSTCCSGVRTLNAAAAAGTFDERRATCACIKDAAQGMTNLDPHRAAGLPGICRVNLPFPISTDTDCNSVQ